MRPTAQAAFEMMLAELEGNQLLVQLVPEKRHTCEGGMIRVAVSKNATWYRQFCAAHTSDRLRNRSLVDTRIKRRNTVRALQQLIAGQPAGKYAPELTRISKLILNQMKASA